MPPVSERARDPFRISIFTPDIDLQFNQFPVQDEEPVFFHAGWRVQGLGGHALRGIGPGIVKDRRQIWGRLNGDLLPQRLPTSFSNLRTWYTT